MPASGGIKLADANVWLAAVFSDHVHHGAFAQSQQDAWRSYDKLAGDPRVVFLEEPAGVAAAFRSFTQADTPAHAVWTDAYLAALALTAPAQLVTFDQGFGQFAGPDVLVLG
jgi:predicted nucleic acid-binding protein